MDSKTIAVLLGSTVISAIIGAIVGPIGNWLLNKQLHKQKKENLYFEKRITALQNLMERMHRFDKKTPCVFDVYLYFIHGRRLDNYFQDIIYETIKDSIYLSDDIVRYVHDTIFLELAEDEESECRKIYKACVTIEDLGEVRVDKEQLLYCTEMADRYDELRKTRIKERIKNLSIMIKREISGLT